VIFTISVGDYGKRVSRRGRGETRPDKKRGGKDAKCIETYFHSKTQSAGDLTFTEKKKLKEMGRKGRAGGKNRRAPRYRFDWRRFDRKKERE